MTLMRQHSNRVEHDDKFKLRHTLRLQWGSPYQHCGSTILFSPLTNRPSNWQIQHCNRTAQR
jgi:hypothetical protein